MTTPFKNDHRPRVARTPDKRTSASREARSVVVARTGPSSPFWIDDVKNAGKALIQAGANLTRTLRLRSGATVPEVARLWIDWDKRFDVYAAHAEMVAVRPEDITGLGLILRASARHPLAPPVAVTATYDQRTLQIRICVRRPPGDRGCRIEASAMPLAPGSFRELPGVGARRALSEYAPGTYAVRAAMVGQDRHSPYAPPVFVTVP